MGTEEFDAGDFKLLKGEIANLSKSVERLTSTIEQNTRQLSKIEVLEVNHNHTAEALGRAFKDVKDQDLRMDQHERDDQAKHDEIFAALTDAITRNEKEHKDYDKYLYMSIGFVTAVCLFWTIFGVRINAAIDDNVKAVAEIKLWVATEQASRGRVEQKTNGGQNAP